MSGFHPPRHTHFQPRRRLASVAQQQIDVQLFPLHRAALPWIWRRSSVLWHLVSGSDMKWLENERRDHVAIDSCGFWREEESGRRGAEGKGLGTRSGGQGAGGSNFSGV